MLAEKVIVKPGHDNLCYFKASVTNTFGGSSGPFFPQADTPNPATSAATTNKRMII